ncbi:hypothetical protein BK663_02460 [Pseudomonas lini]|uniref:Uncharacterized protein n=1 Tax=Pseudomonas lini TaxID=163011 RepID=A0A423IXL1_9PSED|nr:hypothetical protein BK663_02460 [Pseudomonas lini]
MADPLDKATSKAPATLGEGCLSRYDPDDLSPEDGTEFPGAAELWEQLQDRGEGACRNAASPRSATQPSQDEGMPGAASQPNGGKPPRHRRSFKPA